MNELPLIHLTDPATTLDHHAEAGKRWLEIQVQDVESGDGAQLLLHLNTVVNVTSVRTPGGRGMLRQSHGPTTFVVDEL